VEPRRRAPQETALKLLPLLLLTFAACGQNYEADIRKGNAAIAAAKTDAERAAGLSLRGAGSAEKARYLRAFKRISRADYDRLFEDSRRDHEQAAALAPGDAQVHLKLGLAYYFHAYPGPPDDWETKNEVARWLALAEASFSKAAERDRDLEQAWDMRALVRHARRDFDGEIADFEQVQRLKPRFGRLRLATAYCDRGRFKSDQKLFDAAAADFEQAISLGAPAGHDECDPYWPLAWIHLDRKDFEKSWSVVRAAKGKGFVAPEFVEELKRKSGRDS
jgi:tetratricopeptide (TPR) repeat protein